MIQRPLINIVFKVNTVDNKAKRKLIAKEELSKKIVSRETMGISPNVGRGGYGM